MEKKLNGFSVVSSYHDRVAHQIWLGTFHQGVLVLDDRTWNPVSIVDFGSLSKIPQIPVRSIIPYKNDAL